MYSCMGLCTDIQILFTIVPLGMFMIMALRLESSSEKVLPAWWLRLQVSNETISSAPLSDPYKHSCRCVSHLTASVETHAFCAGCITLRPLGSRTLVELAWLLGRFGRPCRTVGSRNRIWVPSSLPSKTKFG